MDHQFFWDDDPKPIRRMNNTLTPHQAQKILDTAIEDSTNNELIKDLKTLKQWLKAKI
jgi:hypothetical protein